MELVDAIKMTGDENTVILVPVIACELLTGDICLGPLHLSGTPAKQVLFTERAS
jgi:hypothetical protein